jgi:hypothetical protein
VDLNLGARIRRFFVENLRNSWLLRAILASNRQIPIANLFGPDFLRGYLTYPPRGYTLQPASNTGKMRGFKRTTPGHMQMQLNCTLSVFPDVRRAVAIPSAIVCAAAHPDPFDTSRNGSMCAVHPTP